MRKSSKWKEKIGQEKNTFFTKNRKYLSIKMTWDVLDPHHDGLVITLYAANHFVRRILIDGGSSVNIVLLVTLDKLNILDSNIVWRSLVLVGLCGGTKNTIREIKLPMYIEGVNSIQHYGDSLSWYNIILGMPLIHDMKFVLSTYYQCLKMSTPWGVVKINNDQQESKYFYSTSMKNSAIPRQA